MKKKDINYYRICDLFRKVITSLVCIEYKISNESIKEVSLELQKKLHERN